MSKKIFNTVVSAGGIVINSKDQIALVLMKDVNAWDFPKGGINKNEKIFDAAKREIYEEAGIEKITVLKKLPNYIRPAANNNPIIIDTYMYLFKTEQEEIRPISDDILEAKWVNKVNVLDNLSLGEAKDYYKTVVNEI
jgi:8-oxo-dGTP pyrophosphatase MutT (NUDIX family)